MHGITRIKMACSASFGRSPKLGSKVNSRRNCHSSYSALPHRLNRRILVQLMLAFLDAVVSMDSIGQAAFAMASMSDALAKEAHHEIRMDESSNRIASVQGSYTIIFTCDGRPPSTVDTAHLPSSFVHVPGPASLAPQVLQSLPISIPSLSSCPNEYLL